MLKETKSNKVTVDFGGGKHTTFTAGGRRRYVMGHNFVLVNGTIKFADGSKAYCLLEIDESSSGEHWGTGVFLPNGGFAWQDDKDFATQVNKTKGQIYPYRYRYAPQLECNDHHVGEDGWSKG